MMGWFVRLYCEDFDNLVVLALASTTYGGFHVSA